MLVQVCNGPGFEPSVLAAQRNLRGGTRSHEKTTLKTQAKSAAAFRSSENLLYQKKVFSPGWLAGGYWVDCFGWFQRSFK